MARQNGNIVLMANAQKGRKGRGEGNGEVAEVVHAVGNDGKEGCEEDEACSLNRLLWLCYLLSVATLDILHTSKRTT